MRITPHVVSILADPPSYSILYEPVRISVMRQIQVTVLKRRPIFWRRSFFSFSDFIPSIPGFKTKLKKMRPPIRVTAAIK